MMVKKSFWISEKIFNRLKALGERDGFSIPDMIRRAVIEFLKREE